MSLSFFTIMPIRPFDSRGGEQFSLNHITLRWSCFLFFLTAPLGFGDEIQDTDDLFHLHFHHRFPELKALRIIVKISRQVQNAISHKCTATVGLKNNRSEF